MYKYVLKILTYDGLCCSIHKYVQILVPLQNVTAQNVTTQNVTSQNVTPQNVTSNKTSPHKTSPVTKRHQSQNVTKKRHQ